MRTRWDVQLVTRRICTPDSRLNHWVTRHGQGPARGGEWLPRPPPPTLGRGRNNHYPQRPQCHHPPVTGHPGGSFTVTHNPMPPSSGTLELMPSLSPSLADDGVRCVCSYICPSPSGPQPPCPVHTLSTPLLPQVTK